MFACPLALAAAGYTYAEVPACWEDYGDAENGPDLTGHPDMIVWSGHGVDIAVIDGKIVQVLPQCPGFEARAV